MSFAGGARTETLRAALVPDRARVGFVSDPPGALVRVDGAEVGRTPLQTELTSGARAVEFSLAGYRPAARRLESVTLERGEARSLSFKLPARLGEVEIAAEPPDAEVLVDGEPRGQARQTLRLTAQPHAIEVRRPGCEPHRVTLTPRPGFPQAVRVRLRSLEEAREAARPRVLRTPAGHELRRLDPGRFRMGASRREPGRRANETLREVELARPSYLAVREVTNAGPSGGRTRRPGSAPGPGGGRVAPGSADDRAYAGAGPARRTGRGPPLEEFFPRERIPADSAVAFPVDI